MIITKEVAEKMAANPHFAEWDRYTSITDEAAQALAQFKGVIIYYIKKRRAKLMEWLFLLP